MIENSLASMTRRQIPRRRLFEHDFQCACSHGNSCYRRKHEIQVIELTAPMLLAIVIVSKSYAVLSVRLFDERCIGGYHAEEVAVQISTLGKFASDGQRTDPRELCAIGACAWPVFADPRPRCCAASIPLSVDLRFAETNRVGLALRKVFRNATSSV